MKPRNAPPINTKRASLRRLRANLTRSMYAFLRSQAPKIAAQVNAAITARGLRKADLSINEIDAIEAIVAGVDFAGWSILVTDVEDLLADIVADGTVAAFAQIGLGVEARAEVLNVVNEYALAYGRERSAEMVGMRADELGRYVPNPAAEWQITESTRDFLRADVTAAVAEGWSNDTLAAKIADSYGFGEERAATIARTETNLASNQGALIGYKISGVVAGKQWLTAEDDRVSEECELNGDAGVLALDADFPSGDDAPPVHPNCRCTIIPVVDWNAIDNIPDTEEELQS